MQRLADYPQIDVTQMQPYQVGANDEVERRQLGDRFRRCPVKGLNRDVTVHCASCYIYPPRQNPFEGTVSALETAGWKMHNKAYSDRRCLPMRKAHRDVHPSVQPELRPLTDATNQILGEC